MRRNPRPLSDILESINGGPSLDLVICGYINNRQYYDALAIIAAATADISPNSIAKMAREFPHESLDFCLDRALFYYCEQLLNAIKPIISTQYFRLSILNKVSEIMSKYARDSNVSEVPLLMTTISTFNKFL